MHLKFSVAAPLNQLCGWARGWALSSSVAGLCGVLLLAAPLNSVNSVARGGQGLDTEPSHRVDRVQGRGQEEDKRRTRPGHRAQPQS